MSTAPQANSITSLRGKRTVALETPAKHTTSSTLALGSNLFQSQLQPSRAEAAVQPFLDLNTSLPNPTEGFIVFSCLPSSKVRDYTHSRCIYLKRSYQTRGTAGRERERQLCPLSFSVLHTFSSLARCSIWALLCFACATQPFRVQHSTHLPTSALPCPRHTIPSRDTNN